MIQKSHSILGAKYCFGGVMFGQDRVINAGEEPLALFTHLSEWS